MGIENLVISQNFSNLHRAAAFHAEGKNPFDHLGGFFIYNPAFGVVRVLLIAAIRWIYRQWFPSLPLSLVDSTDFPAGITRA